MLHSEFCILLQVAYLNSWKQVEVIFYNTFLPLLKKQLLVRDSVNAIKSNERKIFWIFSQDFNKKRKLNQK